MGKKEKAKKASPGRGRPQKYEIGHKYVHIRRSSAQVRNRTNTHSATSSNLDTAVYANLDTAELGYGVPVEPGYLHACMPRDLARLGQEASTSRTYSKVVGNGVYKGRKC